MFFLTKRIDAAQCTPGEVCMVLADFSGVPAGSLGIVSEVYDGGVSIAWYKTDEEAQKIIRAVHAGKCYPASGFSTDGFASDELDYLAFATLKHPKVDATVHRITQQL